MNSLIIMQGAQYYLPIQLFVGETEITDQNCDDVQIKLMRTTLKASEGKIAYGEYSLLDHTHTGWLFPLTERDSLSFKAGAVPCQAKIKIGDTIIPTPVVEIEVDKSIINEVW